MKKYTHLKPCALLMPGVNLGPKFIEKCTGKSDAKHNQVCSYKDGHITPTIEAKVNCYDSHINKVYLKTMLNIEQTMEEANALVVEFNLLNKQNFSASGGNSEEAQRQEARVAFENSRVDKRKEEILIRLASIKAELDMVNEMLLHYVERAEGKLHSRISKYWRGVLAKAPCELEHVPIVEHKFSPAKEEYENNRKHTVEMIESVIAAGGGSDV